MVNIASVGTVVIKVVKLVSTPVYSRNIHEYSVILYVFIVRI